jgi:5-methylcytosine-specific restriction endonuclease McrA
MSAKTYIGDACQAGHSERYESTGTCVECIRAKARAWHAANRERVKARKSASSALIADQQSAYYRKNAAAIRARKRQQYWCDPDAERQRIQSYREQNREEVRRLAREAARRRYRSNPEKVKEAIRAFRIANPDLVRKYNRINKHNRRQADGKFNSRDIENTWVQQRGRCAYFNFCGEHLSDGFHIDHAVPITRGGSNWPWNLQLCCPPCNLSKHNRDPLEFMRSRQPLHAEKVAA